jgi:hypothetical protein
MVTHLKGDGLLNVGCWQILLINVLKGANEQYRFTKKDQARNIDSKKRDAWIRFLLMRRTLPTKSTKSARLGSAARREGRPLTAPKRTGKAVRERVYEFTP